MAARDIERGGAPDGRRSGSEQRAATVARAAAGVLEGLGLRIYDVVCVPGTVRVLVDRPGGVDLEVLERATRALGPVLDGLAVLRGSYALEVSSPGLERPLRRPEHYAGAVGEQVVVRARAGDGTTCRHRGRLVGADAHGCDLEATDGVVRVAYRDVVDARTVFAWPAASKPSAGSRPGRAKRAKVGSS